MQNLWRDLRPGPRLPDSGYAIVEIPNGSRNKYEYPKDTGTIVLDRVLVSSLHYPGDYGLIPRTFYKVLGVPATDPLFSEYHDLRDDRFGLPAL
jgi:inorganic pyrophosphatase